MIGKNELVGELESLKVFFSKVAGLQEQMVKNLEENTIN